MRHGSQLDPANRFESTRLDREWDDLEWDDEYRRAVESRKIDYLADESQTIVTQNNSPDLPFRYSINPYRGCAHGCSYCYARNTHEYLGMNAGLDFETKILVKHDAPRLLREFLARDSFQCEPLTFSGVTDCYQPAEREFQLTRQCLAVASECHVPISIVTKNALVVRDLDLLAGMASRQLASVFISITSLDAQLARVMEPRTSIPAARLRVVEALSSAGVPVGVMIAPVVPGLNDHEIPALVKAARDAGACDARYLLLRLPLTVEPVFREWLARTQPTKQAKVESFLRQVRDGRLNSAKFGERHTGTGELATQIGNMFRVFHKQQAFAGMPALDTTQFCPATPKSGQRWLF